MYRAYPELRGADIEQTGPCEITIKVPTAALITAVAKFGASVRIVPPEVVQKYGSMADWHKSVDSGPFILKDFVSGGVTTLERNPNYLAKDPIGPGKGNQLPYIDGLQYLTITDMSTQQAAMRTGEIDRMLNLDYEDAAAMRTSAPDLVEGPGILGGPAKNVYMNSQFDPLSDVKVCQALMMATDLNTIKDTVDHGQGQILTGPVECVPAYKRIYLGLDHPAMPASVKQLYTYNPDQARQLLSDAELPNGFKTTALISQDELDYFSIIKDMWSKVGVELNLIVVETGVRTPLYRAGKYDIVGDAGGRGPIIVFYHMVTMVGQGPAGGNEANINDPLLQQASTKMQEQYLTDTPAAMATFKDLMKYVLDQAYVIPRPEYRQSTFWWP